MTLLPLFLARRFLRSIRTSSMMRSIGITCFFSFMLSTCSLALVAAVMKGLEHSTLSQFQDLHPDIMLQAPGGKPLKYPDLKEILIKEYGHLLQSTCGYAEQHGIIFDNENVPHVVEIQACNPEEDAQTRPFFQNKSDSGTPIAHLATQDTCLIGKELAQTLDKQPNDIIDLVYLSDISPSGATHATRTLTLKDTFTTQIDTYDRSGLICSLSTMENLFHTKNITLVGVRLHPNVSIEAAKNELAQDLPLQVFTWENLYPGLVATLTLETYALCFIFGLITLVASMNIVSLLFMHITQQKNTIAIMRSMGMPAYQIQLLFSILGVGIATVAALFGIGLAWCISYLLNEYHIIPLPDMYYASHLPANMSWTIACVVFSITLCVSLLASYWGTYNLKRMELAHVLKDRI